LRAIVLGAVPSSSSARTMAGLSRLMRVTPGVDQLAGRWPAPLKQFDPDRGSTLDVIADGGGAVPTPCGTVAAALWFCHRACPHPSQN
jgi:hypothetical protein